MCRRTRTNIKPADSRYDRGTNGGQVTPRGGAEGGGGGDASAAPKAAAAEGAGGHVTAGYACSSVITGHTGHVNFMVAAKGQLFSASQDQTVRVWGLQKDGYEPHPKG